MISMLRHTAGSTHEVPRRRRDRWRVARLDRSGRVERSCRVPWTADPLDSATRTPVVAARRNPRHGRRPGHPPVPLPLATASTGAYGSVGIRWPGPYDGACTPGQSRLSSRSAAVARTVMPSTADQHSSTASVPDEDTRVAAAAAGRSERPSSAAVTSGNQRIRLDTPYQVERRYAPSRTGPQAPGGRVVRDGLVRLALVPGRAGGHRLRPALVTQEGRAR